MIHLPEHLRLRDLLEGEKPFPLGVELVSTRGTMSHGQTVRVREFAEEMTHSPLVDWVSITDNAGGNPQLAPVALGTPVLYAGKEVVIHLTCKDLNRHGLESQLWMLASQGFHNILAMTGDYPGESATGRAKPVFDIDSVGLLAMIRRMNEGVEVSRTHSEKPPRRLDGTHLFSGAVASSFKSAENTLIPQYLKLEKKIETGARFIVNQIGFDSRRAHEMLEFLRWRNLSHVPLIGNVYVLSATVARLFHSQRIPGVTVTEDLLALCERMAASPDKGRAFFLELAAKQMAVYRGLGFSGAYLGGVHRHADVCAILEIERSFATDDWRGFAREIHFSHPDGFYLFDEDPATGLCRPGVLNPTWEESLSRRTAGAGLHHSISKAFHALLFERGKGMARLGAGLCTSAADPSQGPAWLRGIERVSKSILYRCCDCGDCSLAETAFLCPESQCAKNQRNGPCGGTRDGRCEMHEYECIWARAYDRMKADGQWDHLLDHAPVVQDQGLRRTSAWANYWLGRDHTAKTGTSNQS